MGSGEVAKKQKKSQGRENVPQKNSFKVKPQEKKSWKGRARYFTKTRMIPCLPETSCAVSGFCHVVIHSATREKSSFSRLRRSYLRPLADTEDSCRTQEKPQGTRMTTSFGGRRKTSARTREDKTKLIINQLITLLKTKYITI